MLTVVYVDLELGGSGLSTFGDKKLVQCWTWRRTGSPICGQSRPWILLRPGFLRLASIYCLYQRCLFENMIMTYELFGLVARDLNMPVASAIDHS